MNANAHKQAIVEHISPTLWGPALWSSIHTIALHVDAIAYKDSKSFEEFKSFVHALQYLLPCAKCKVHYSNTLLDIGYPTLGNAFAYTVNLHNQVNEALGKPIVSINEAYAFWNREANSCSYSCDSAAAAQTATPQDMSLYAVTYGAIVCCAILIVAFLALRSRKAVLQACSIFNLK